MENIQPWCISRQLWWGHQIPAWYGPDGKVFVAETEAAAKAEAKAHYGEEALLKRDEDVLDTWFSSGLWPFSTLGWPDDTPELKRYYPTSVLVTGFDIIFFWVARMMMMGLHFMKEVPFRTVYLHGLVSDERGQKMSKSKGNTIDPLELIDQFGADALRFTLAAMTSQARRDVKLSAKLVEGYRNFATKLWNAARFAEMNGCVRVAGFEPRQTKETLNRWIVHETAKANREVTEALEGYRFNDAASATYRFVWNVYCDWYVEFSKPLLTGPDGAAKDETRATAAWALDQILKLLHPFMPFLTEELWQVTAEDGPKRDTLLITAPWPQETFEDAAAEAEIGWAIDLITAIRSVRAEMNIPPATQIPLVLAGVSAETKARAGRWAEFLQRLARVPDISFADAAPAGSVQLVVRGEVAALPLKGLIDVSAERTRLEKEMAKADADIKRVDAKLSNEKFVANAPAEIIEGEKEKRQEAEGRRGKIQEALERLKGAA
jgi:valyl-tRNA synthetase